MGIRPKQTAVTGGAGGGTSGSQQQHFLNLYQSPAGARVSPRYRLLLKALVLTSLAALIDVPGIMPPKHQPAEHLLPVTVELDQRNVPGVFEAWSPPRWNRAPSRQLSPSPTGEPALQRCMSGVAHGGAGQVDDAQRDREDFVANRFVCWLLLKRFVRGKTRRRGWSSATKVISFYKDRVSFRAAHVLNVSYLTSNLYDGCASRILKLSLFYSANVF